MREKEIFGSYNAYYLKGYPPAYYYIHNYPQQPPQNVFYQSNTALAQQYYMPVNPVIITEEDIKEFQEITKKIPSHIRNKWGNHAEQSI